jgi:two-component system sensor histidine kinase PilS (NtrC family)
MPSARVAAHIAAWNTGANAKADGVSSAPSPHLQLGHPALTTPSIEEVGDLALSRAWYGFMTARSAISLALMLLQGYLYAQIENASPWLTLLCAAYFASALAVRLFARPRLPRGAADPTWLLTAGIDVLAVAVLQAFQNGTINYAPLLGVPVLQTAVLGTRSMAIGMALAITLLLVLETSWGAARGLGETTARYLQSVLTGLGYLLVAFLGNQLAARLVREEQLALASQHATRLQTQVNELVIEALSDGVLVVDATGSARAVNPAARQLLGAAEPQERDALVLSAQPGWAPLLELAMLTFARESAQVADITLRSTTKGTRRVRVRTRMTETHGLLHDRLCVMFLHDLREVEARLRTEKMAAMGRMSAAVAHEIRNPLAAITQANALLSEDLQDESAQQLTCMIRQNAQRLSKIVDEVLDVARLPTPGRAAPPSVRLDDTVVSICSDWMQQAPQERHVMLAMGTQGLPVDFDADHLQRVLVNLLGNALRYVSGGPASIQVATQLSADRQSSLLVWSDGPPLEDSVERHLFEPFFSSESRSSGLGLYICRELCERHRATIGYQRAMRSVAGTAVQGNEFSVHFRPPKPDGSTEPRVSVSQPL